MSGISDWLAQHDLGRYADLFTEHEIEPDDLPELAEDDLKEMGLPIGPRRRILKVIREETNTNDAVGADAAEVPAGIVAERRQLTVMFVDLVGSTALSERLDPEDLADVLRLFKEACATAVAAYDGHISSYMGDGVMVFFGFPHAHEDDAERAIHAGLRVLHDVPRIATHAQLKVRVGIATGLVVVGDLRGAQMAEDGAAMGETPNLAARLQSLAEPGTLIVSPVTRRLAGEAFEYVEHDAVQLKGFSDPVRTWQVTGARINVSRFRAGSGTLGRMIGRGDSLRVLQEKWRLARTGAGQAVTISGEPGIGKSRLIEELRRSAGDGPHLQMRFQCSPYHQSSALYPVIRQMERASGLMPGDAEDARLDKLAKMLRDPPEMVLKLTASLMSVPFEERLGPLDLAPQQLMDQTQDMLLSQLLAVARDRPILILFEDAHWIDPTTRAMLDKLAARLDDAAILLVVTHRPGFDPGWRLRENLTSMPLGQLDFAEVRDIVNDMTGGAPMPVQVFDVIAARTNGVPLFVEEVTRDLLESGVLENDGGAYRLAGPLPDLAVPSTLQDALMARLDRLGAAKEIAQTAAVFGPQVAFPVLATVARASGDDLERSLDQLTEVGILSRTGTDTDRVFTFHHALVRDTAYHSLLRRERQAMHGRAAEALRAAAHQTIETEPEVLAHHYAMSRNASEAAGQWQRAGRRAVERSANLEASSHLTQALEQLGQLDPSPERDAREIEIQVLRAGVLRSTAGIAADATGEAYARIRDLCRSTGETGRLFPTLNGLYAFYLVRAEYNLARDVAQELLDLAEQSGETQHRMVAHRAMGAVLLHIGQLVEARDHLEQALDLYDPVEHGRLAYVYGTDHAAITSGFLSMAVWLLGQPGRAVEIQERAVVAARELDHGHSKAQALAYLCMLYLLDRNVEKTRQTALKLASLSEEHSFVFMAITARFWLSWTRAWDRPGPDTIAEMRDAAEAWWSGGAGNYKPYFLTLIAEAWVRAGDTTEVAALLASAREFHQLTNEGWALAETDRIEALAQKAPPGAALETARRQGAPMLELRAALDMAGRPGAPAEAAAALIPLLAAIEGGEASADVLAARDLLAARGEAKS